MYFTKLKSISQTTNAFVLQMMTVQYNTDTLMIITSCSVILHSHSVIMILITILLTHTLCIGRVIKICIKC